MKLFRRLFSDKTVEKKYVRAGACVGDFVSYSFMGEPLEARKMTENWEGWEEEYSRRGYRTISLDDFIQYGGYGKPIGSLLAKKLESGEKPIFHAKVYKETYFGKIKPSIDTQKEGIQTGLYILPSTEQTKS